MSRDLELVNKVLASLKNIGSFELSPLRESADSSTFKAWDANRRIAITIRTEWPSHDDLHHFLTHARSCQALDHGNIARIIGAGELEGAFFLVASFIDGRTLRESLLHSQLTTWDLIDFARQACLGLEAAHAGGLVHHALNPDNIVLEFDGSTKILDCGLYRNQRPGTDPFTQKSLYLAPEQLDGHAADRNTNLYSVAAMLYEIATGKAPSRAETWDELRVAFQSPVPEPISVNPSVPPGINAVLVKALARDRMQRFSSGSQLVRALEEFKSHGKPATPPAPAIRVVQSGGAAAAPARAKIPPPPPPIPEVKILAKNETKPAVLPSSEIPVQPEPQIALLPVSEIPPAADPEFVGPTLSTPMKATRAALEAGEKAVVAGRKIAKRVDPWIAALVVLGVVGLSLGFVMAKSMFSKTPVAVTIDSTPIKPLPEAPAPGEATTIVPITVAPQTAAASPVEDVTVVTHAPRKAAPRKAAPKFVTVAAPTNGTLSISVQPAGASVLVDGASVDAASFPLTPGSHTLTISKDGFTAVTRQVQISAGAQSHLDVQLEASAALLTVMSNPSGAFILLDGNNTGHVTPAQIPVAPGSHSILLRKLGFLETTDSVTLKAGEPQSRNLALLEAGSTPDIKVAQTSGVKKLFGRNKIVGTRISIRSNPAGATVIISGQSVGKATPVEFGLNPGSYVMELQLPGYQTLRKTITVTADHPIAFDENLQP